MGLGVFLNHKSWPLPASLVWQLSNLAVTTVRSTTGLNVYNIRQEFGKDPLLAYKKLFRVEKAPIPDNGLQTIELLDYLLFIRKQVIETGDSDDIISELDQVIFQTCST